MDMCHFCGNKNIKDNKVQYIYKRDNNYMIVEDVPCKQCEFCGEQYFEASVLKNIEMEFNAIHLKGKSVENKIVIPVEVYADINGAMAPS